MRAGGALLLLLAVTPAAADVDTARIDAAFAEYARPGSPGCAVGVVASGAIIFARGYGFASVENEVPITPRTIFDLGSTSKQITSAAVALLVLDGRLSLDDDIRKYLPEIPVVRGSPAITVRRLLDHTSGLRDYTDLLSMEGYGETDLTTSAQGLAVLARQRGRNFPAGAEFRYTNSGHFLASILVQRVSGKSLRAFARERIFAPLGMTDSTYFDDHALVVPRRATGYAPREGGGFEVAMSDWEQVGDGGVQSSIEEMALWAANLDTGGKLGGRALVDLLHTPGTLADGTPIPYGLGLFFGTYRGLRLVEHGGAWAGYRANLVRVPERRVAVITLCNVSSAATRRLALAALDAALDALPESDRPPAAPASATVKASPATTGATPPAPASSRPETSFVGRYVSEHLGDVGRVELKPEGLFLEGEPLRPIGPGRFGLSSGNAVVTFSPEGTMTVDDPRENPRPAVFKRLPPEPAGPSKKKSELAGRYRSADLDTGCLVAEAKDTLEFSCGGGEKTAMSPLGGDLYNLGWGVLRVKRDERGAVESLLLTTRGLVEFRLGRTGGPAERGEGRGSRGV
ncbi:MAG TPA: serine hydrolase domain-containing protein [Candidatus Polarisedimenticolia bacterium]|nr:serine hydrolase domain-containing protein [Candidatus Polarisedimenticolia bacterium]